MPHIHSSAVSDKVLVQNIVAAISEVHAVLGPGLMDTVYEEALAREFGIRKINYQRQAEISIIYKETLIGRHSVNFLVEGRVLLEFQTEHISLGVYQARLHSYLRAVRKRSPVRPHGDRYSGRGLPAELGLVQSVHLTQERRSFRRAGVVREVFHQRECRDGMDSLFAWRSLPGIGFRTSMAESG